MITFPDYRKATNAAYKLIADRDQFSLATNVFAIAEQLDHCIVFTYGQTNFLYGTPLEDLFAVSEYGFSIKKKGSRIIYFNEKMPLACIRFTLAHEIGHAILEHQDEDDPYAEKEANCFARNLLCPAPIVSAYDLLFARDYVSVFDVSADMARVAIEHHKSDAYYIDNSYSEIINDKIYALNLGYESLAEFEKYMFA